VKPAICPVCGTSAIQSKGDHVEFSDYEPLPSDYIGHPHGYEWFCADHLEAAKSMSNLPAENVIKALRDKFSENTNQPQTNSPVKAGAISRIIKAVTGR